MPPELSFTVNGQLCSGKAGDSLLAALLNAKLIHFRAEGQHRHAPICGMGICFECLVTVRGRGEVRACMVALEAGMEVEF